VISRTDPKILTHLAQKNGSLASATKGWGLGGWFGIKISDDNTQPNKPIKARLGEESSFVYDHEMKRWVNKKAGKDGNQGPLSISPPRAGPPRSISGTLALTPKPGYSRNASLDPECTAFSRGQVSSEWSMVPPQFTSHRRTFPEYSDGSASSAAPSPNLPHHDNFLSTEPHHSPLVRPQDPSAYNDALGLGNFSLSDPQVQHAASPGLPSTGFVPSNRPAVYGDQSQGSFGNQNQSGYTEIGQAQQTIAPEINVEFAPLSKQSSFPAAFQCNLCPKRFSRSYDPALTFEHILMNDHLYALYVGKHLPVNTIGNATKVFILGKRSSSAKAN
jgi:hypothetical protein